MKKINLKQNKTTESYFTQRFLNNDSYFSRENKRFFNVKKTLCYEIGDSFGAVIEYQGAFIPTISNESHIVLKLVSNDRNIITVTSGFKGNRNGHLLFKDMIKFLKNSMGCYEKDVLSKLKKISLSNDYKNTLLFEDFNNKGFYLYFGLCNYEELRIIGHK